MLRLGRLRCNAAVSSLGQEQHITSAIPTSSQEDSVINATSLKSSPSRVELGSLESIFFYFDDEPLPSARDREFFTFVHLVKENGTSR